VDTGGGGMNVVITCRRDTVNVLVKKCTLLFIRRICITEDYKGFMGHPR
jgi:hypothetical protein